MQKTSHWEEVIGLEDYFTDADKNSYFVTKLPKMSLEVYLSKRKKDYINLKLVVKILMKLSKVLVRLHSKKIVHRDVCMDNIAVKKDKHSSSIKL